MSLEGQLRNIERDLEEIRGVLKILDTTTLLLQEKDVTCYWTFHDEQDEQQMKKYNELKKCLNAIRRYKKFFLNEVYRPAQKAAKDIWERHSENEEIEDFLRKVTPEQFKKGNDFIKENPQPELVVDAPFGLEERTYHDSPHQEPRS